MTEVPRQRVKESPLDLRLSNFASRSERCVNLRHLSAREDVLPELIDEHDVLVFLVYFYIKDPVPIRRD